MLDSKHPSPAGYPVSRTNAAYSPRVTSYFPNAKDRNETLCCGDSSETDSRLAPWLAAQDFSDSDEPIMNLPAGITTISGQSGHSRNTVPGTLAEVAITGRLAFLVPWPNAVRARMIPADR